MILSPLRRTRVGFALVELPGSRNDGQIVNLSSLGYDRRAVHGVPHTVRLW
jgi:hypothetical protein